MDDVNYTQNYPFQYNGNVKLPQNNPDSNYFTQTTTTTFYSVLELFQGDSTNSRRIENKNMSSCEYTNWRNCETSSELRKNYNNSQWVSYYNNANSSPILNNFTSFDEKNTNPDENKQYVHQNEFDYYDYNDFNNANAYFQNLHFEELGCQNQTENSSESDIIVEESDNNSDFSEDTEGKTTISTKCLLCNISYTPGVIQFYYLTNANPVTMTSQQPVLFKLKSMIGHVSTKNNHLCRECLGLLNSIDHFQTKLAESIGELRNKFRKTCMLNNTKFGGNSRRRKFKLLSRTRCKYCRKILDLRNYYKCHLLKYHKRVKFLCEKCGNSYRTLKVFRKHACETPELLTCCGKTFKSRNKLKEHQNFCTGNLPYDCKNCDKKFATTTKLKNHIKLKHDKKFIAICSICNVGFVKISDYKTHKISHTTDKKFNCKQCGKSYKTLSNLKFHLKSHSEILPFTCNICRKGFMRKEYLETHLNNHAGVKNFICTICRKRYNSQKNLDAHFKYHDGSITKKICNICGKSLTTSMNDHLRIHNNLREFECNLCDLKFNTKGTLMKHKKIKH